MNCRDSHRRVSEVNTMTYLTRYITALRQYYITSDNWNSVLTVIPWADWFLSGRVFCFLSRSLGFYFSRGFWLLRWPIFHNFAWHLLTPWDWVSFVLTGVLIYIFVFVVLHAEIKDIHSRFHYKSNNFCRRPEFKLTAWINFCGLPLFSLYRTS